MTFFSKIELMFLYGAKILIFEKIFSNTFLLTNMFYDSSHLLETKNNKLNKLQLIEMWKTFYSKKKELSRTATGGKIGKVLR